MDPELAKMLSRRRQWQPDESATPEPVSSSTPQPARGAVTATPEPKSRSTPTPTPRPVRGAVTATPVSATPYFQNPFEASTPRPKPRPRPRTRPVVETPEPTYASEWYKRGAKEFVPQAVTATPIPSSTYQQPTEEEMQAAFNEFSLVLDDEDAFDLQTSDMYEQWLKDK